MSNELLDRLADAVVSARVVVPPITHIELDDVPALNGKPTPTGRRFWFGQARRSPTLNRASGSSSREMTFRSGLIGSSKPRSPS